MARIDSNNVLTKEAKMTAHSIRFAILGAMYPTVHEKYGKKFVCFTNGKDVVFVSNRNLNQLAFCSNLNNACKAAGVKVDLSPYARNMVGEEEICRKVYEGINNSYVKADVVLQDNAMAMFLSEEALKDAASNIDSAESLEDTVSAKLAYANEMVKQFPKIAKEAGIDENITTAALGALVDDLEYIKKVRQRKALNQFEEVEKE